MRITSTKFLCVLAALTMGGTVASVGCSGTAINLETGGAGGKGGGSAQGGFGNSNAGGNGGDGNGFIPSTGAGANDGGLDPDIACAAKSAAATLEKKPVDIVFIIDNSGSMTDEIVGVQNTAVESVDALKERNLRCGEMARGADDEVKIFRVHPILHPVMHGDVECLLFLVPFDHTHWRLEAHPFAHLGLFDAALDIIPQHRTRWIGRDGLAEMFLECIVGEFQTFLRPI